MRAHRTTVTGHLRDILEVDELKALRENFECPGNELYHVTSSIPAESILNGKLRYTRADTFFDKTEIKLGLAIFRKIIDSMPAYTTDLMNLINEAESYLLASTFVFSSTFSYPDEKHVKKYGGTVLKCKKSLNTSIFYHAYEVSPKELFPYFVQRRFKLVEGKVIYNINEQRKIAQSIIDLYIDCVIKKNKCQDYFENRIVHDELVIIMTTAICLFKKSSFKNEMEFRFIAFSLFGDYLLQACEKSSRLYIEVKFKNSDIFAIDSRQVSF